MNIVHLNMIHTRQLSLIALSLSMLTIVGCASGGARTDPDSDRRLEVKVFTEDGRQMAYRLERDGTLHFAGGRAVLRRNWSVSGTPTPEQRAELWQIIDQYDLLTADGSFFASPEQVRYDVVLHAGREQNRFITVDDRVPGLAELTEALADLHSELRDADVYREIEGAIERSGGNVPQR
ncbi:MAG: hypothetical protein WD294_00145 [Phycisphaeraceae bacterium]